MKIHFARLNIVSVFWMIIWAFTFNFNMALNKLLSEDTGTFMAVFTRLFFGVLVLIPFIFKGGVSQVIPKTFLLKRLVFQGIIISISMAFTYYAYANLPLVFATSLGFSAPLMTAVLAFFLLGDKLTFLQWMLILVGYGGVIVLIHPSVYSLEGFHLNWAVGASLMANLTSVLAFIHTKKLTTYKASPLQIILFPYLVGLLVMGGFVLFYWRTPQLLDYGYLALMGLTATLSQYCKIKAVEKSDPAIVSPFEYLRLVVSVPLGFILFNELPTYWTWVGSLIIVVSTLFLMLIEVKTATSSDMQKEGRKV